ncbi:protein containing Fumarate reductase/succinate dehydrogenase flavoprotein [mine drainage metagenome]|uniref:Protein containing Fumarate reductase/succinate dehydrogenase flavoprotein n=1 Tax=mine drainage metagenome TaxID=410659 RepID=T0Z578_9ZZZZ
MLVCAEAVARAALLRKESRGAHSRLDYPKYDDYWGEHNIVSEKRGDAMHVEPCPVIKAAGVMALVEEKKAKEKK